MLSLHIDLLSKEQKITFEKLKIFAKEATLAGGTALSLQIGHRYSFDFDLFFNRELKYRDIAKLKKVVLIKEMGINTEEQKHFITEKDIRIHLVFYPFSSLFKKIKIFSIPLYSIKDIALDKAYTIGRRATWRDYIDLYVLLKNHYISLSEIIALSSKKFGFEFNERLFIEQLVYFRDIEVTKISFVKEEIRDEEIKNFLTNEVKKWKKGII